VFGAKVDPLGSKQLQKHAQVMGAREVDAERAEEGLEELLRCLLGVKPECLVVHIRIAEQSLEDEFVLPAFRRRIAARSGRVIEDSAFPGSRVLDRPRDLRPLRELLLADDEKVDGQQHPVEGPAKTDHFLEAVRDDRLDHHQVDVAVAVGVAPGVGSEEQDPRGPGCHDQPLHGGLESLVGDGPGGCRGLAHKLDSIPACWARTTRLAARGPGIPRHFESFRDRRMETCR